MNDDDPILVLTTGGTIDKVYFDALSQFQIGLSRIDRLLAMARVTYPYVIRELMRKDSLAMTPADRERLLEQVLRTKASRILITHGTDTMTDTAETLAAVHDKTIVLTGALSPSRFAESDAAFNVGMAFAIAQTASPGVYITMNGVVFRGNEARKDRESERFVRRSL